MVDWTEDELKIILLVLLSKQVIGLHPMTLMEFY